MNLKTFYWLPILIAIFLISSSIYIANFEIEDDDVDSFISHTNDLQDQAEDTRDVFEEKTTREGLSGMIEEIPIFGGVVKTLKFLSSIVGTLRSGLDTMIFFFNDVFSSEVLGIDSRIISLIIAGLVGAFGFAVYDAIRKGG